MTSRLMSFILARRNFRSSSGDGKHFILLSQQEKKWGFVGGGETDFYFIFSPRDEKL